MWAGGSRIEREIEGENLDLVEGSVQGHVDHPIGRTVKGRKKYSER